MKDLESEIIEWLRNREIRFVFEEDLDLGKKVVEKLKENLFESKVSKDLTSARSALETKAKTYYSNEALNPRPKRGRPPKQAQKVGGRASANSRYLYQGSSRS